MNDIERTILDHFHPPDNEHSSWWIRPSEMAAAVRPLIESEVREQAAQDIEAWGNKSIRFYNEVEGRKTSDSPILARAAEIVRGKRF